MADKLTPNQVVAWNLWRSRKALNWTQEQTSDAFQEHGISWGRATYYAIEASRLPGKETPRRFSADELLAFSLTFGKPVSWFLTPPEGMEMVLADSPLSFEDLVEMGLHSDALHLEPLADQLRSLLTAIEKIESSTKDRAGKPAAAVIVEQATAPVEGDKYGGETGHRRLAQDTADSERRRDQLEKSDEGEEESA